MNRYLILICLTLSMSHTASAVQPYDLNLNELFSRLTNNNPELSNLVEQIRTINLGNSTSNLPTDNVGNNNNNNNNENVDNNPMTILAREGAIQMEKVYNDAIRRGSHIKTKNDQRKAHQKLVNALGEDNFIYYALQVLISTVVDDYKSSHQNEDLRSIQSDLTLFTQTIVNLRQVLPQTNLVSASVEFPLHCGALTRLLFARLIATSAAVRNGDIPVYNVMFQQSQEIGHELLMAGRLVFLSNGRIDFVNLPQDVILFNPLSNETFVGPQNVRQYLGQMMWVQHSIVSHNQIPTSLRQNRIIKAIQMGLGLDLQQGNTDFSILRLNIARQLLVIDQNTIQLLKKHSKVYTQLFENAEKIVEEAKKKISQQNNNNHK